MFDIGTKIKHAWKTIWDYKSLWFFVFIMTLTGAGGVSSGGGSGGNTYSSKTKDLFNNGGLGAGTQLPAWMNEIKTWVETNVVPLFSTPEKIITTILWIIAAIFLLAVILSTLMALLRYPSETAVIRMVNDYEQTGTKIKFKAGWGLGWNQRALRLWMIDLVLSLPGIFFAFMVVLTGILVLSRYINGDQNALLASSIVLICVALIFFLVFGLIGVFLGLLRHFVARAAVLDGTNVRESFKRGWQMLTHNFKNIFLTWLVMLGIGIGFGFVVLIGAIILIPAYPSSQFRARWWAQFLQRSGTEFQVHSHQAP